MGVGLHIPFFVVVNSLQREKGNSMGRSQGQAAEVLGCAQHKLGYLVQSARIRPPMIAGRRVWSATQIIQAAKMLDIDSVMLRQRLASEVAEEAQSAVTKIAQNA